MIASKHTSGPWFWCGDVLMARRDMHSETVHISEHPEFTKVADKALIASAPELLEALKLIECNLPLIADSDAIGEDECTEIPITWKEWSQIRAAIAKAEGRQP